MQEQLGKYSEKKEDNGSSRFARQPLDNVAYRGSIPRCFPKLLNI